MPRIVQLTTVHPRFDTRIYSKECKSLAAAFGECELVVADGKGDERDGNLGIHDIGAVRGRFRRMTGLPLRAFARVRAMKPDIVHIHDPELLPVAWMLRLTGRRVIYDAHEDLPRAILNKDWIAGPTRSAVAWLVERVENFCARRMSAVVTATPTIERRFQKVSRRVVGVYNYPNMPQLGEGGPAAEPRTFCYVGVISRHRSIMEMITATELAGTRLLLAGRFEDAATEAAARALPGWRNVEYFGAIPHDRIWAVMQRSLAGLLFFYPEPNHVNALPNKMFEYMAAGLPVLCSDFADWREIVSTDQLGFLGDPQDAASIAALMQHVAADPDTAAAMGRRARELVSTRYRWESEAAKLVALYGEVLGE